MNSFKYRFYDNQLDKIGNYLSDFDDLCDPTYCTTKHDLKIWCDTVMLDILGENITVSETNPVEILMNLANGFAICLRELKADFEAEIAGADEDM